MKKLLFSIAGMLAMNSYAQTFSDNFDTYTAGQKLAAQSAGAWTTWTNQPGGANDVLVSNADAVSGSNSIYYSSTSATGGPTDIIRHFGTLNTGQFSMKFNLKVESGKAGYFNLQKLPTPGSVPGDSWAMDCFFNEDGTLKIVNTQGLNFNSTYTQGTWMNFRVDINFNTNVWEIFIDDVSKGTFSNPINQIASINFFPIDQVTPYSAGYFVDDFQYTVTPYTLPAVNAAAVFVSYPEGSIAGAAVTPTIKVRNLGSSAITSFDLALSYNGTTINKSVTGINLASLAQTEITMDNTIALISGTNNMVATVSNVNGSAFDGDPSDNQKTIAVTTITPANGKLVVGEEGTGTWCQYCPSGTVAMDNMENKYPQFWAGIAVHNNDPMMNSDYDQALAPLIASSYPRALVDRGNSLAPAEIEPDFLNKITVAPTAMIENGATWDATTRVLKVSVAATFNSPANNNYKLAVVLTEDEVTGTGNLYAQVNAFAGGGLGPMGGFESLPNPVPAAQMVYDHVARAIEPSFTGYGNSFPATVNAGETHAIQAQFILPPNWDETKIHIIGLLIAPNGKIDNAGKATIEEAVDNGLENGTVVNLGLTSLDQPDAALSVYPNPAADYAIIAFNLSTESQVSVRIIDISGKVQNSRDYGTLSGANTIELNTANFAAGVYTVEVVAGNSVAQKRLVIKK